MPQKEDQKKRKKIFWIKREENKKMEIKQRAAKKHSATSFGAWGGTSKS